MDMDEDQLAEFKPIMRIMRIIRLKQPNDPFDPLDHRGRDHQQAADGPSIRTVSPLLDDLPYPL